MAQALRVESGALEWLPQENIFYPDAAAELLTTVRLRGRRGAFIGWEIACLGLPASAQDLNQGRCSCGWNSGAAARRCCWSV